MRMLKSENLMIFQKQLKYPLVPPREVWPKPHCRRGPQRVFLFSIFGSFFRMSRVTMGKLPYKKKAALVQRSGRLQLPKEMRQGGNFKILAADSAVKPVFSPLDGRWRQAMSGKTVNRLFVPTGQGRCLRCRGGHDNQENAQANGYPVKKYLLVLAGKQHWSFMVKRGFRTDRLDFAG